MLRILPPADVHILPQAELKVYFFNRIGQKRSLSIIHHAITNREHNEASPMMQHESDHERNPKLFTNESARLTVASHYLNELALLKNSSFALT